MLDPLHTPLVDALSLNEKEEMLLEKAGLETVEDLLYYFPLRYEDFSSQKRIVEIQGGETAIVSGTVTKIGAKNMFGRRTPLVEAYIEDSSGDKMRALWFYQPGVAKAIPQGSKVLLSGKVRQTKKGALYLMNPVYELINQLEPKLFKEKISEKTPFTIYPPIRGLSNQWFKENIKKLLPLASQIEDPIPREILKRYNLSSLKKAFSYIHTPPSTTWATAARKRFAFEEIFLIQLERMKRRKALEEKPSFHITEDQNIIQEIESRLAFPLTKAQKKAARAILGDLAKPHPMARLLEGDVGSGKTLVAVIAALAVVRSGFQVAYLAPTEILARQHFEAFMRELKPFRTSVGLITSAECKVFPSKVTPNEATHISRSQLLTWMRDGKTNIVIGTHAMLQEKVGFKKLALVVVDEQHRFGIKQRGYLARREKIPHLLSMTATPIPRTLALTIYGDLDLSLLDEMPPGRKKVLTRIVAPEKRTEAYEFIRKNIKEGGQAFVICPKIEVKEDGKKQFSDSKAVTEEYKKLKDTIFPELNIGMLHGKIPARGGSASGGKPGKEEIIQAFRDKKTDILVSTSVIEVGIDIPNASIMMIEGAERFGLASLHQFRGRVGRGGQQAYCLVFTESKSPKTKARMEALLKAKNGFELAEYDLAIRGPGELSGTSQWGISDIGMEALKNIKMVEAARKEAALLLEKDIDIQEYPILRARVEKIQEELLHFE